MEAEFSGTIAETLLKATSWLRQAGLAEARREAGTLLAHVIARDRAYLIIHADEQLTEEDAWRFRQLIARRAQGEPVQYITGRQEFYGLDFAVTPDVLIPRPETELLVETALELVREMNEPRLCDVGTGSGCIVVTLLHQLPNARATALDISPAALRIAARNAARHGVEERLELLESDCFTALDGKPVAPFSIVVSNPPYIAESELDDLPREVREYEPRPALTPGGDGLGLIRRLLTGAPQILTADGLLLFEIGFAQHTPVAALIDARVWTLLDIHKDLQGIPRVVALRRTR